MHTSRTETAEAPLDLDAIETLLQGITPGDWGVLAGDEGRRVHAEAIRRLFGATSDCVVARVEHDRPTRAADTAFIAGAPGLVRSLVDEVRRLRRLAAEIARQA